MEKSGGFSAAEAEAIDRATGNLPLFHRRVRAPAYIMHPPFTASPPCLPSLYSFMAKMAAAAALPAPQGLSTPINALHGEPTASC